MKFLFTYISFIFLAALGLPGSLYAQVQPPSFLACEDVSVCSFGTKDDLIHVDLQAEVTNHCISNPGLYWTTHIDLYSDGSVDQALTKADASGEYPLGIHTVTFWAADGCGGVSSCQRVVTVKDCLPPVVVCKDKVIELLPATAQILVNPADLLDPITADNITLFSDLHVRMEKRKNVEPGQVTPDNDATDQYLLSCEDLPPIEYCNWVDYVIWTGDEAGNWSSCESRVEVMYWQGACAFTGSAVISASNTHQKKITKDCFIYFDVDPDCSEHFLDTFHVWNNYGFDLYWIFPSLQFINFSKVEKKDDPANGIDSYDLYLLKKMILVQSNSAVLFQREAGDLNGDCELSITDYLLLRKQIMTNFIDIDSFRAWQFVPKMILDQFGIPDLCAPQPVYDLATVLNNGPTYIGYKLGDLNHDHQVDPFTESDTRDVLGTTAIRIPDQQHISGEEIALSLPLPSEITCSALQLELDLDEDNLVFVDLQNGGTGELTWDRISTTGHIRILWVSESPGDVPQFSLILKARKSGELSTSIKIARQDFWAIVYTLNGEKRNLDLIWSVEEGSELIIRPLLSGQTSSTLSFWVDAPKRGEYTVNLFDLLGRGVYQGQIEIESGGQQINLPIANMPSGVLACRITKNNQSAGCSTLIQE